MAMDLKQSLTKSFADIEVETIATKHAGHARELARQIAADNKCPLIVSSSGDGGYNEVVNGVMESGNPQAICAVLPAGNANDHSRTMQNRPLAESIKKAKVTKLDLLRITINTNNHDKKVHYAHSYAGLGLTPVIATELNQHTLNAFREIRLVLRTFFKYRPFKIRHDGKIINVDSLLFANINQMAKVLTLAPENHPDDGKFEVILFPSKRKWKLVKKLAKAAVSNLNPKVSRSQYNFTVINKMPMQLDGEVILLSRASQIKIESAHKSLKTII